MATPSITDLQSLVNRLTADNNRLRNLVKLYEAALMTAKCRLRTGGAGRRKPSLRNSPPMERVRRSFS